MSGDFLAFQIHQDPKYFPITPDLIHNGLQTTEQNMWRFPNLLGPIGLEAKIYPIDKAWAVNEASLNQLNEVYGDKNILLPAHWYSKIEPATTNGLFDQGIRLYASSMKILKFTYALWWIKSHVIANEIWLHRWEEIDEYERSDRPNKHLLPKVMENYHNWKYMSLRYNLLNNGEFDLRYYVEAFFKKIYSSNNWIKFRENYLNYDVDKIFYSNWDHLDLIEQDLDVTIDRHQVKEYALINRYLIEDCLGFDIDSPEFEDDNTYYDAIINYAKDIINERTYQFDYYNRKRNQ